MPQGDKRHYTGKQKRQAGHIEESLEKEGYAPKDAEGRAWATVNAIHGGGELPGGGGYGKPEDKEVYRKGARLSHRPKRNAKDDKLARALTRRR